MRLELLRARLIHEQRKQRMTAEIRSSRPKDIAAIEELDETVESSITDLETIHDRKKRELDHNIAFERSMAFQEQLNRLGGNEARRRDDTLTQLELYRAGLALRREKRQRRSWKENSKRLRRWSTDEPLFPLDRIRPNDGELTKAVLA